jgi:protein-disulfide isomerase
MYRALYEYSDSLGLVSWSWFASAASVRDSALFTKCIKSASPIPALDNDIRAGEKLKIQGTPLLLVGPWRFSGLPAFDSLRAYIRLARDRSP